MSGLGRGIRVTLIGWALLVVFAVLVLVGRGMTELWSAVFFAAVAVVMGLWVYRRRSRAALVTSLILGGLHTVEQVAYLVATATADDLDAALLIGDLFGLAVGLIIVTGSVMALRSTRGTTVRREASLT